MMRQIATVAAFLAGLHPFAEIAMAQGVCGKRERVAEVLAREYEEVPVARGATVSGSLVELFVSDSADTWTLVVTTPQRISCVMASGDAWEQGRPSPRVPHDKSVLWDSP